MKSKIKPRTREEIERLGLDTSSPLQKTEDALNVNDIIKDDAKLVQVHFISDMMVMHKKSNEIQEEFEKQFGEKISLGKIYQLKQLTRAVYLAEISRNRDDMIAEELMQAEWELRELKDYWYKSKMPKTKKTIHDADSNGTELTTYDLHETTDNIEDSIGDLEAMKRISEVHDRVIRLLGLNAKDQREEENAKGGTGTVTINIVGASNRNIKPEDVEVVQ